MDGKIKDYMTTNVFTAHPESTLSEACAFFREMGIHHLPVVDHSGQILGMLSANDVLFTYMEWTDRRRLSDNEFDHEAQVNQVMTKGEIYVLTGEDDLNQALILFCEFDIHAIPIVEKSQLIGILTSNDILRIMRERINAKHPME